MPDELIGLTAWLLSAVAAINWGATEALDINLLTDTLSLGADAAGIAYLVIGVAGIVQLYLLTDEVM